MTEFPNRIYDAAKVIGGAHIILRDIDRCCKVLFSSDYLNLKAAFRLIGPKTIPCGTSFTVRGDGQVVPDSKERSTRTTLRKVKRDIGACNRLVVLVAYLN